MSEAFTPISVILPVHSEPYQYIRSAFFSVIHQSYPPAEVILIDDSGCARYENLFKDLLESCNTISNNSIRCICIFNTTNLGLINSLNRGLNTATCDIIARMDADDYSLPQRFELQINYIENGYDIVGGSIIRDKTKFSRIVLYPKSYLKILSSLIFSNPLAHPTVMFRRKEILKLGGYNDVKHAEDLELWMRAFLNNFKIGNVTAPVLIYRDHPNQVSILHRKTQQKQTRRLRYKFLISLLNGSKL